MAAIISTVLRNLRWHNFMVHEKRKNLISSLLFIICGTTNQVLERYKILELKGVFEWNQILSP